MKIINLFALFFLLTLVIITNAQVGIGTISPAASAQLDVTSTSTGLLPPRMTETQRNAIATPATGLMVWCSNCGPKGEMQVFNGTNWTNMIGGVAATVIPSVTICSQAWMTKNLDVITYRNGDPIPKVTDNAAWGALTTGAYCYYNNDSVTYAATYGKLYNWYAVNDPRGLAPTGWHVPSDAEWATLSTCLGGAAIAGGPMKEIGTTHWTTPNTGATNSSGFTGLPGGYRISSGSFSNIANYGYWWSSVEYDPSLARSVYLNYLNVIIELTGAHIKQWGFTVRCLKD